MMSRNILAAAALVALAGCVTVPPGVTDEAAWRNARGECQTEAASEGLKAASLGEHLSMFTVLDPADLPDDNPRSEKWQEKRYEACMAARGLPAGPYRVGHYLPWSF